MKTTKNDHYLIPNPSVQIVVGYKNCVIIDLVREIASIAKNSVYYFIQENQRLSLAKIYDKYDSQRDILDEYLNFFIENEYVFLGTLKDVHRFQKLNLDWNRPSHITNAVLEYSDSYGDILQQIILQLSELFVEGIELFIPNCVSLILTSRIISQFNTMSHLTSFNLYLEYDSSNTEEEYVQFSTQCQWVNVFVLNSPYSRKINNIIFLTDNSSLSNCGIIEKKYFVNNLPFFTEAQCHNTCLNRKVCIDAEGNIKNCPAMSKSYGNVRDTTLEEAINKPGFKDCWTICKDQIDVCKDCEFRYMCTDCRAFIKDPCNIYSQPAKCTYNPYICLWEGQDGYVPVEACGTYSRATGFVPDKEKIARLNSEIWGEEE